MAFTYNPTEMADKDQVRFLILDTVSTRAKFQDEEIMWALAQAPNIYICAAELCEQLAIKAGGGIKSKKISEFAITYDTSFYQSLAGTLRSRGSGYQVPYAGGISVAEKLAVDADSDAIKSKIKRNLGDNPAAPAPEVNPTNPLVSI